MVDPNVKKGILEKLDQLPFVQQRQVLQFAQNLVATEKHGVPGQDLIRFAGKIEADDLSAMQKANEYFIFEGSRSRVYCSFK